MRLAQHLRMRPPTSRGVVVGSAMMSFYKMATFPETRPTPHAISRKPSTVKSFGSVRSFAYSMSFREESGSFSASSTTPSLALSMTMTFSITQIAEPTTTMPIPIHVAAVLTGDIKNSYHHWISPPLGFPQRFPAGSLKRVWLPASTALGEDPPPSVGFLVGRSDYLASCSDGSAGSKSPICHTRMIYIDYGMDIYCSHD